MGKFIVELSCLDSINTLHDHVFWKVGDPLIFFVLMAFVLQLVTIIATKALVDVTIVTSIKLIVLQNKVQEEDALVALLVRLTRSF